MADPDLTRLRERIEELDLGILASVNERLGLVAEIRRYKESRGMPFFDPEREEWLLRFLSEANPGPLSETGVRELFAQILELLKREVG